MIGENKMFNLDVKYVDIDIEVTNMGTSLGTADINPVIISGGKPVAVDALVVLQ